MNERAEQNSVPTVSWTFHHNGVKKYVIKNSILASLMLADNKKFAFRKLSQMFILMVFFTNNTWDTIKVQFRFLQMNLYLLFHCSFFPCLSRGGALPSPWPTVNLNVKCPAEGFRQTKVQNDRDCWVFKFLRRSVDGKHLMRCRIKTETSFLNSFRVEFTGPK